MPSYPTREAVASTRLTDVLLSGTLILMAGQQQDVLFELDLTTTDRYLDIYEAGSPDDITMFESSMGHLLDVEFYSAIAGFVIKLYTAVDAVGGTPPWMLKDQWLVTPGVMFTLSAYRIAASYGKLSIINTTGSNNVGRAVVRLSSL